MDEETINNIGGDELALSASTKQLLNGRLRKLWDDFEMEEGGCAFISWRRGHLIAQATTSLDQRLQARTVFLPPCVRVRSHICFAVPQYGASRSCESLAACTSVHTANVDRKSNGRNHVVDNYVAPTHPANSVTLVISVDGVRV